MRLTLLPTILLLCSNISFAQWNVSGNNINNTNTGNVGIGFSTPIAKLHVHESTPLGATLGNFQLLFKLTGLSSTNGVSRNLWLLRDAAGTDWYTTRFHDGMSIDGSFLTPGTDTKTWWERDPKDNIQSWGNANQTYFTINAGNVGIGTVTPGSLLHLKSNTSASVLNIQSMAPEQFAGLNLTGSAGVGLTLNAYGASFPGGGSSSYTRANGMSIHTTANDAAAAGLAIAARNPTGYLTFHSGGDGERMRISANGNVGIGSAGPNAKLQIYNSQIFNLDMTSAGQDNIILLGADPGNGGYFGGLTWESAGRRRASIAATREGSDTDFVGLAFFTKGVDGPGPIAESMRITRDGNVGIGTTIPDQKLTVKGIIHAEEVRVDMTVPGPDYVFASDYKLLSLAEVESFITENKHLPEVPSAKQMAEDGLNLKEMNLLLLKKVEELTLHLIELNKKNELQYELIKKLLIDEELKK